MDAEDIIALYDAHAREIVAFLARRSGDPQLALDLTAATFLRAFEQRRRCRGTGDRERAAWLYRIAGNELADHYRRGAKERRTIEHLGVELRGLTEREAARIEELAESDELQDQVAAAFGELSGEQQDAVRLHVMQERPYAEISQELGVSEPAARARVSRGLRALRRSAEREQKEQR